MMEPVLYIHPAKQGVHFEVEEGSGRAYGLLPVGAAALVNRLRREGIGVRGLNYAMEKALRPGFSLRDWLANRQGVRIILVDLHWYEHCYGALEMVEFCKETLPWAWTVIGGLTASGFAQEILENFPAVDVIIRGDAEQPLLALAQRLLRSGRRAGGELPDLQGIPNLSYRREGKVVHAAEVYVAATADLDELDFVHLDFMDNERDYLRHEYLVADLEKTQQALASQPYLGRWICNARGCIYHCSYCGGSKDAHKRLASRPGLVTRSPKRMADDLKALQAMGVHQAAFSYDLAELGEAYWRELFDEMRRQGVKIGIYNEFFQSPDAAFIAELARAADMEHTCVALSPLSGNERVRRLNGKHYSNERFFDVLEALNEHNFYIFVYFSLNLPGESEETFQQTLELAEQVYDFYPSRLLKILDTVHTLDPFSPMMLSPEKYGIEISMRTFMDWYAYCQNTMKGSREARTEAWRGFTLKDSQARRLRQMADAWDAARVGKERSWWLVPPSW